MEIQSGLSYVFLYNIDTGCSQALFFGSAMVHASGQMATVLFLSQGIFEQNPEECVPGFEKCRSSHWLSGAVVWSGLPAPLVLILLLLQSCCTLLLLLCSGQQSRRGAAQGGGGGGAREEAGGEGGGGWC